MKARTGGSGASSDLKHEYFEILRKDYRVSERIIEELNQPSHLPTFKNVVEIESYCYDNFDAIGRQFSDSANYYWNQLLGDLMGVLRELHSPLCDVPIFVGQVPDVTFNAYTRPLPDRRYMILVNQGLAMLLDHVAHLVSAGMHLKMGKPATADRLELEEMKSVMRQAFDLVFQRALPFRPVKLITHSAVDLALKTHYSLELAVLAHELGHVGQFYVKPYYLWLRPYYRRHRIEFLADNVGSELCLHVMHSETKSLAIPNEQAEFILTAAPIWICYVLDAYDRAAKTRGVTLTHTHPDGLVRAAATLQKYLERGLPEGHQEFLTKSCELLAELTSVV
jgi:hypothetical protein